MGIRCSNKYCFVSLIPCGFEDPKSVINENTVDKMRSQPMSPSIKCVQMLLFPVFPGVPGLGGFPFFRAGGNLNLWQPPPPLFLPLNHPPPFPVEYGWEPWPFFLIQGE